MKTTRFLSILLTVLMVLSMLTVGVSAYTVPDGYKVAETPGMNEAGIDGEVYGLIGDADFNDKVNVKDATTIQKYAASLINLDEIAKVLGDVNFDTKVNVIDATTIQKWVAGMEVDSPINHIIYVPTVETTPTVTESTPAETESTPAETESTPAESESTPAETESTPAETESTPAESESTPAETESTPAESDTIPADDTVTVYFSNNKGWENVYIYGFNGQVGVEATDKPLGEYPGTKMVFVRVNEYGQDIYSCEVPADIDYIKFSDGSAANNRTDNIPNDIFEDNTGFYLEDKGDAKYWPYATYEYSDPEADSTPAETETTPAESESTPAETESTPAESDTIPADDTVTVYFSNNKGWENVYIYGFYGVVGETSTGEPLGVYPGTKMTFVRVNEYGQDIYSCEVPADIDYIKFSDGSAANNRTDNIPNDIFEDNTGFYLEDKGDAKYWPYATYEYADSADKTETTPAETESTPAETESTPAESESTSDETTPVETETTPAADTITVYFSNNKGWENAYIYGFYGVAGETSTGEPLGVYPGTKMTFVRVNEYGQDIYSCEVPADIDYIKFSDGSAANNRTDNIPNDTFEDNTGFYLEDKGDAKYWPYATYEYADHVDETETTPAETESTPAETESTPAESESTSDETTPVETETTPAADTITVYFSNNKGWENAYIYGFYGVAGETSTGEPLGVYPGTKMTFVRVNEYGQDIYSCEVPADIDYIKFSDGSAANNRTDNIPNDTFEDNTGFYLEDKGDAKYWPYATYEYADHVDKTETTPAETESTPAETESTPAETESTPAETEPAADTVTVYFTNNWAFVDQYVYYWGTDADPTWPGVQMTYVRQNSSDQAIYSAEIPADVDGIIFNGIHDQDPNVRRQTVDIKEGIVDNAGFYCDSEVDGKITVGTYIYEDVTPTESTPAETESTPAETESTPAETESTPAETESTPAETESTPAETESTPAETESTPAETESTPAADTITVYFSNNKGWENAYIYGFYGVAGETSTGEPLGVYPGTKMTFVRVNEYGQDIYSCEVPADIDYIKFSDGSAANNRTDNIPNAEFEDNTGFYLEDKGDAKYWPYATYEYADHVDETESTPAETESTPAETESTPAETETTPAETETTPAETETTPAETEPEVETYTVKFVNGAKWAEVRAYAWNDSATWPGVPMTKTGEKVNGFDVYEVTFDVAYQNIIFNNNNNGSQTSDLKFQNGKVYDIKSAKWYDTIDDIPAVAATATDRYLVGSFNNWNTTALEFKLNAEGDSTAYAEIELKANTTYEFKVVREGAWTSYNGTITGSATGLQFSSSVGNNAKITTKAAGTYVFAFGMNDSKLSVTYPG